MRTLIIGAGAYGLALSNSLKGDVFVYSSISSEIEELNLNKKSRLFDVSFSHVNFVNHFVDCDYIIIALPTSIIKSELEKLSIPSSIPIIIASKGMCDGSFIYDVVRDVVLNPLYILSGPSFARDLVNGDNVLLTLAGCDNLDIFKDNIKLEYTRDVVGVEVCGTLKNIFAIGCGIIDGMGCSDSTKASFLTMVVFEVRSILSSLNCSTDTVFLSCGVGDIILTCTSHSSRNFNLGYMIGSKQDYSNYISSNTVEGVSALKSIKEIIDNDLVNSIYDIVFNGALVDNLLEYMVK